LNEKTTKLHSLLKELGVLPLPIAYDCLSARIAETVGFKAIFIPTSTAGEAQLGLSAVGLAAISDVENWGKRIENSVNIPVILSAIWH
jgi:methylisocitrate lyase